jgi:hypothetical protein
MVTWQVHLSTSISKVHGLSAMYNLDLVLVSNLSRVVIFEYRMVLFPYQHLDAYTFKHKWSLSEH